MLVRLLLLLGAALLVACAGLHVVDGAFALGAITFLLAGLIAAAVYLDALQEHAELLELTSTQAEDRR